MASTLPTPSDCCNTCDDVQRVNVPGPPAEPCEPCEDGDPGCNAYGLLSGPGPDIPAWGDQCDIIVERPCGSGWMTVGQVIYIEGGGYYEVIAKNVDGFTVTVENLGYPGNPDGIGAFVDLVGISPGGLQGPEGAVDPTLYLQAANNLNDLANIPASRVNLGLGTAAQENTGITNGDVPVVDAGGGLIAGDSVWGTALGVETKVAADARTALGLGTMAVQNANNVNITGGSITGITFGTSGIPKNYILLQNKQATTVAGGGIVFATWVIYPFSAEIWDTGNDCVLAGGGSFTLQPGTYRCSWRIPLNECGLSQTRFRNFTTGEIIYGSTIDADASGTFITSSQGEARFTVVAGAGEVIQIETQASIAHVTDAYGRPSNFGGDEIYGAITLEKEIA